jgi:hypothetical protein
VNKTEAKLVAYLLRWALGQESSDPSHPLIALAERVRAALGEGPDRDQVIALHAERRPKVTVREPPAPPRPQWLVEQERERREREQAAALAAFDQWARYLGSTRVGKTFSSREPHVFRRVSQALSDVRPVAPGVQHRRQARIRRGGRARGASHGRQPRGPDRRGGHRQAGRVHDRLGGRRPPVSPTAVLRGLRRLPDGDVAAPRSITRPRPRRLLSPHTRSGRRP